MPDWQLPLDIGWHIGLLAMEVPGTLAALHALFHKRDPRGALGWVVFCIAFPVLGAVVYLVFGMNRVRRVARSLKPSSPVVLARAPLPDAMPGVPAHLEALERLVAAVTGKPLLAGNRLRLLCDGEQAYAAMLSAIHTARHQVLLSTYIFDAHGVGASFVAALADARSRGVEVRVMIDGVGEWYSLPRVGPVLRKAGVSFARFQSPKPWSLAAYLNMRNHRKILVVDGWQSFAGGMNIRNHHVPDAGGVVAAEDIHFALEGPISQELAALFIEDWRFVSDEPVGEPPPLPAHWSQQGDSLCRLVEDGPDENIDKLTRVILAAIHQAERQVSIATPYFLPPHEIMIALQNAALRGVAVTVLLPRHNNLPFVDWASRHILTPLLAMGVNVLAYEGAFLHTKLLMIDETFLLMGSHNLDPRSLRLNFELGVEVHDPDLCQQVAAYFSDKCAQSTPLTVAQLAARPFLVRLRDAAFWLFSPYL